MTLVKAVVGEVFQLRPELLHQLSLHADSLDRPIDKLRLDLRHQVGFLLSHSLTQSIRLTAGKATDCLRDIHELLLIDQYTIGLFQLILHGWVWIGNRLSTVLASDERVDELHRTGTI